MSVIDFQLKRVQFQQAAQNQRQAEIRQALPGFDASMITPNFEDPHSSAFPPEPRDEKAEGFDLLGLDGLLALRRFAYNQSLSLEFDEDRVRLYRSLSFDTNHASSIQSLFAGKATRLLAAEIIVTPREGKSPGFSLMVPEKDDLVHGIYIQDILRNLDKIFNPPGPEAEDAPGFWR